MPHYITITISILLIFIAACTSEQAATKSEPTILLGNLQDSKTILTFPTPSCDNLTESQKQLCLFEQVVNNTIQTNTCIEKNNLCQRNRNYASCIQDNQGFGCHESKQTDTHTCNLISNTSISDHCKIYLSFTYDDITQCNSIQNPELKDICLYGFLDRTIDCIATNYPCRTTHKMNTKDCAFSNYSLQSICQGITTNDSTRCYQTDLPGACDLIFAPTISYTTEEHTYSWILRRPDLDQAFSWITKHTLPNDVFITNWELGHIIRATTKRNVVATTVPINIQPDDADNKTVFSLGDYTIQDKPYWDEERYGPQSSQHTGTLIASFFTTSDPNTAAQTLLEKNVSYVLVTISDIHTIPLYELLAQTSEDPLLNQMNTLRTIKGFELVYHDDTTAIYKVKDKQENDT
ncbi:MAG: hypothetical protein AABX52_04620 [Nanoarchaeota archaeon]